MGLSLSLQDLRYISQVPTLFAVTNKHEKLFSIFCSDEPDSVIFKEKKTLWLLNSLPSYHILISDSSGNKRPSSLT